VPSASSPQLAQQRRAAIVDGAMAVIAEVGPDGLTHRRVAAAAGVSLAATTRWFASKEDIVEAAFLRSVEESVQAIDVARERVRAWTADSAPDELAAVVERECTRDRERTIIGYALWIEAQRRPVLRPAAQRWTDAYVDLYRLVLRTIGATGDVEARARLLAAAVDGLVSQQLVSPDPLDRAALADVLRPLLVAP
jgi:TetR/AcrR family transcriptional regulator, regulator of biofilm formation and stress response